MRRKVLTFLLTFLAVLSAKAQMGILFNADNQLSSNFASQVFQDNDGFIWVATRNGLNRYDGYKFSIFKKEDNRSELSSNYVNCVAQSRKGTLYVGTNTTVQTYDGARFHNIQLKDANGKPISTYIKYLLQDSKGEMLACTSGYGIIRLDEKTSSGQTDDALSGGQRFISFAMEDSMGRLWLITENNGIVLIEANHNTLFFQDIDVAAQRLNGYVKLMHKFLVIGCLLFADV